ncbi:hypothetical protein [Mycetohabitans rhizoxinica]|uniref:hypothetical protein n=1 Tax=Mycetohabitans rhizoxinica TaxID=412963 RepID=UPI0030CEA94D
MDGRAGFQLLRTRVLNRYWTEAQISHKVWKDHFYFARNSTPASRSQRCETRRRYVVRGGTRVGRNGGKPGHGTQKIVRAVASRVDLHVLID